MTNPLNTLSSFDLFLGSGSPRRQALFASLDIPFKTIISDVEEIIPEGICVEDGPVFLSELKSNDLVKKLEGNYLLVTADTVVLLNQQILGKPEGPEEAAQMLMRLQGRSHVVITGVTIRSRERTVHFSDKTIVGIASMTPSEINWSVHHSKPFDKAGAYGIQDWIGLTKVNHLNGSYYNVMGLPVDKLYEELMAWSIK